MNPPCIPGPTGFHQRPFCGSISQVKRGPAEAAGEDVEKAAGGVSDNGLWNWSAMGSIGKILSESPDLERYHILR